MFEKGIATFKWPHVKPLWHRYLDRFIERYGGSKLERARDLFEQVRCVEVWCGMVWSGLVWCRLQARVRAHARPRTLPHALSHLQAVTKCPADCAAELFLKYAKLEEEHGLVRHAMGVYDRATRAVKVYIALTTNP